MRKRGKVFNVCSEERRERFNREWRGEILLFVQSQGHDREDDREKKRELSSSTTIVNFHRLLLFRVAGIPYKHHHPSNASYRGSV